MEVGGEVLSEVILRAKSGDRGAFDILYKEYVTPLYRYVYIRMRSKEDTEDVVQETFLKAFQALPRYEHSKETMLPYLFTIARNLLINHRKKKRPDAMLPEEMDRHGGDGDTMKGSVEREQGEELQQAMEVLSGLEREVIELRFFGEQTYAEIAEQLGKREDAIRQHVTRALKKMREKMREKMKGKDDDSNFNRTA